MSAAKTMTKKTDCNTAEGLVLWVLSLSKYVCWVPSLSRACGWVCLALLSADVYIQLPGFILSQTDDALLVGRLVCPFPARHIFLYCLCNDALPCIAPAVCCIVSANIKLHWPVCAAHFLFVG